MGPAKTVPTRFNQLARALTLSRDFSILLLALAVVGLGFGILTPIMPKFAEDNLDMDASEMGLVYALFALSLALCMLPAGYLADKVGRKPVMIVGILLFSGTTYALSLITDILQFAALRVLEGVGAALVMPAAFALTVDIVPEEKRGMAMGVEGTAQLVGALGGPGLGGILASQFGFYYPFYVAAGLSFLCAVLIGFIREPKVRTPTEKQSFLDMFGAWKRNARKNRALVALTTRGFVMGIVQGLFNLVLVLYWYHKIDMSEAEVGIAMSIGLLVMVLGTLPFGALSDKHGRRPFLLAGGSVMVVGLAMNVFATEAWHVFLLVAVIDTGASMSNPSVGATLADVMLAEERGRVMGAYQMIQAVGNILGFFALGSIYVAVSPEAPILASSAALAVATLIIALFVPETRNARGAVLTVAEPGTVTASPALTNPSPDDKAQAPERFR